MLSDQRIAELMGWSANPAHVTGVLGGGPDDLPARVRAVAQAAAEAALVQQAQTPCDIAEDGVCEVIDCCRNPTQILEALEIGYDSAQAEAAQYHAAMAGYRPERHAAMDADVHKIAKAISTLKAALAQEEPEPVASIYVTIDGGREFDDWRCPLPVGRNLLYTHPPRREWQGLTQIERMSIINSLAGQDWVYVVDAIEDKLKERNA